MALTTTSKGRTMMQELRTQVRWFHVAMPAALTMTALMVGLADTKPG